MINNTKKLCHHSRCLTLLVKLIMLLFLFIYMGCSEKSNFLENPARFSTITTYHPNHNYLPSKTWQKVSSPKIAGWSTEKLDAAKQYAEQIHSDAVVVIYNGVIIANWGNVHKPYSLYSVRKSLMSIMIGLALDSEKNRLNDKKRVTLNSTLRDLNISDVGGLSEVESSATLRDLLTARSGVYHPAAYETKGMRKKRPIRASHPPGRFFYYNNWDFNVLSTIFNHTSGKNFFKQFYSSIALPLQMEQFSRKNTRYFYQRKYSKHPAYLFKMSALDLARVGLLMLRDGTWAKQQIVRADWVEISTRPHVIFRPNRPHRGYGFLWWIRKTSYYAAGNGGQRLFVFPKKNIVIVHLVDRRGQGGTRMKKGNKKIKSKKIWHLVNMILAAKN